MMDRGDLNERRDFWYLYLVKKKKKSQGYLKQLFFQVNILIKFSITCISDCERFEHVLTHADNLILLFL